MLARNPVARAGNQIQINASIIAEDILGRSYLWRIGGDACDMETQSLAIGVHHQHTVANMQLTQAPKYGRISEWAIEVSINYCTPSLARARTAAVPANILPWTTGWRCQIT